MNENIVVYMERSFASALRRGGSGERKNRNNETGIVVTEKTPQGLAKGIITLLRDQEKYARIRRNAWQWSQEFDFEKSYQTVFNKIKESL